eukprot:m.95368 g.95368  ORF g.95368 m.95368 type:complete len:157 (+) comp12327_c1_seq4:3359-3829(+)
MVAPLTRAPSPQPSSAPPTYAPSLAISPVQVQTSEAPTSPPTVGAPSVAGAAQGSDEGGGLSATVYIVAEVGAGGIFLVGLWSWCDSRREHQQWAVDPLYTRTELTGAPSLGSEVQVIVEGSEDGSPSSSSPSSPPVSATASPSLSRASSGSELEF